MFTNHSSEGFKAWSQSHLGRLCVFAAAAVAVVLFSSQSRGLIRALVGGLIAIGRDPTGLRGRTLWNAAGAAAPTPTPRS